MSNIRYNPENIKNNPFHLSGIVLIVSPTIVPSRHYSFIKEPKIYQTIASDDPDKLFHVAEHLRDQIVVPTGDLAEEINKLQMVRENEPERFKSGNFYRVSSGTRELLEPFLPDGVHVDIYELEEINLLFFKMRGVHDFIANSYINDYRKLP